MARHHATGGDHGEGVYPVSWLRDVLQVSHSDPWRCLIGHDKRPQVETQMSDVLTKALQSANLKDQAVQNKLSTRFDPNPYTVLEHKGPSLILQRGEGRVFMRNVSHVRKLHQNTNVQKEEYDMDADLSQAVDQDMDPPQAVDQDVQRPVRVRRAPPYLKDFQL